MTLSGSVLPAQFDGRLVAWLNEQGCRELHASSPAWSAIFGGFEAKFGVSIEAYVSSYFAPGSGMASFGEERSGAGWQNPANFLITPAFIRILAAWEQFEIDVLKALFFYRPAGLLGPESEQIEVTVDYRRVLETVGELEIKPEMVDGPPLWNWIKKSAENNEQRRQIFEKVFAINTLKNIDCDDTRSKAIQKQMYDKRNRIVHGRGGVTMTIPEFVDYVVFVAKSMRSVADQCKLALKVSL